MSDIGAIATFLRAQYEADAAKADTEYARIYAATHRTLLADLLSERHLVNESDCWYTCAAATLERDGGETGDDGRAGGPCDCGRDTRLENRLRVLSAPYRSRIGYQDQWRALSPEERAHRRW